MARIKAPAARKENDLDAPKSAPGLAVPEDGLETLVQSPPARGGRLDWRGGARRTDQE
jgi:hypothetical protein